MNVLIADDHSMVRLGLSIAVKEELTDVSISEAANAAEVLKLLKLHKFSLMLMDIRMPETNSIELLEQVRALQPEIKVLVISLNSEKIFALRYIKAGASGYIEKKTGIDELRKAIRKVSEGNVYMSQNLIEIMARQIQTGVNMDPFSMLAKRELEIAMQLIQGVDSKTICALMNLQPPTVATYKRRIFEKLNVSSTFELINLAEEYGIS